MNFLVASVKKDLARWMRDRGALLIWLGIPFLIGGLITSMIDGNDGGKPTGTLLIANLDDGLLSGAVAAAFGQGELGELIIVENTSVEEGTRRIEAGEASGFLTIPEGFTTAFINGTPVTLTLKTNPAQTPTAPNPSGMPPGSRRLPWPTGGPARQPCSIPRGQRAGTSTASRRS